MVYVHECASNITIHELNSSPCTGYLGLHDFFTGNIDREEIEILGYAYVIKAIVKVLTRLQADFDE